MNYKIKPFEDLEFSDDFIFCKIMHNPEICAGVIERLLHIKVDHIEYPELQKTIQPYYTSKGVRLDVYVKDSSRVFDIEMQTSNYSTIFERMRYYQGILDINELMKGEDYTELKETYIIFICKTVPFKSNDLPVYTFKTTCLENPDFPVNDKVTKAVYNASAYEKEIDKELKTFLNFVCSNKAEDPFTNRLLNLVTQAKALEANKTEYMSMNAHEMDIRRESKKEGAMEKAIEDAKLLINKYHIPIKQACADLGISPELLKSNN